MLHLEKGNGEANDMYILVGRTGCSLQFVRNVGEEIISDLTNVWNAMTHPTMSLLSFAVFSDTIIREGGNKPSARI